jgi:hypothetical protein
MLSLISLIHLLRVSFDRGTNLSSSAYFFPCSISIILLATGMVRDSPIVCGFLALAIECDALYDTLSTYFGTVVCCSINILLVEVFQLFSLEKIIRLVFKFHMLCSHVSSILQVSCYHLPVFQSKSNIMGTAHCQKWNK